MTSLSVRGDPQGWVDLGAAISTVAATLESELAGADSNCAQPLARSWYGPAAASFSASWASRRSRYEQLIGHLHSAGRAIGGYGQRLWELQQQAWSVESRAIEAGLRVAPLGDGFLLPVEAHLLPAPARMLIEHALADAAQGVERLFADVAAAAEDLLFTLGPVVTLLEDFCLAGVAAAYLPELVRELENQVKPDAVLGHLLDLGHEAEKHLAKEERAYASTLGHDLRSGLTHEVRSTAAPLLRDAGRGAKLAGRFARYGEGVTTVYAWGVTGYQVISDARREGLTASLEQNAGDIAETAVGPLATGAAVAGIVLLAPAAPVAVVAVGGVAIGAVVAVGVGAGVQAIVDHRHGIIHAADGALHDLEHLF
jgi:uncharacterized protein YukE